MFYDSRDDALVPSDRRFGWVSGLKLSLNYKNGFTCLEKDERRRLPLFPCAI